MVPAAAQPVDVLDFSGGCSLGQISKFNSDPDSGFNMDSDSNSTTLYCPFFWIVGSPLGLLHFLNCDSLMDDPLSPSTLPLLSVTHSDVLAWLGLRQLWPAEILGLA